MYEEVCLINNIILLYIFVFPILCDFVIDVIIINYLHQLKHYKLFKCNRFSSKQI